MSDAPKAPTIERVVVPLDAASESRVAIETAARLAAHAGAPLVGIFVEDEDLLLLANLPFARQFTLGAAAEPLTTEHVELHLRVAADRARRELLAAATRHGVAASFEIVRGSSGKVLSGGSERDLVVAGAETRPIGTHFRLECRWWSSTETTPGPFLLVRHASGGSGSVVMLLNDRSHASARLLETAAEIAQATERTLTVICPPAVAGRQGIERWIAERLAGLPVRVQVEIGPPEPAALRARIDQLDCRCLAIEAGNAAGRGNRMREFVERFACDILIVG